MGQVASQDPERAPPIVWLLQNPPAANAGCTRDRFKEDASRAISEASVETHCDFHLTDVLSTASCLCIVVRAA